jgi:nitrogen fixation protein FixH
VNPKKLWPAAVIAVLAITVIANAWLFYAAHDQDAAVVEPDYYRKAVAYDTTLAERHASDALGWHVEVALGTPSPAGRATMGVRLTDSAGAPVTGARVRVKATHNRDAAHEVTGELAAVDSLPGTYAAELWMQRFGLWQLDVEAERGAEHFVTTLRCETGARAVR